jgi:hypothetical protein
MEDFASSRVGKKFLEHDLPKLVDVLGKLTEALNESNKIEGKKLLIEQKRFINEKNENARITRSSEDSTID